MCVATTLVLGLLLLGVAAGCTGFESKPLVPHETAAALEQRSLESTELKDFFATSAGDAALVWPPQSWTIDMLVLAALYYHPSLAVARAEWDTARAGEITAGQRPNPTLALTPQYVANAASGTSPWLAIVDLDVPVETAGKRARRIEHAQHASDSARLRYVEAAWHARSSVRTAVLSLESLARRKALLRERLDVHEQIVAMFQQRLRLGDIARFELTAAELARDKTKLELGNVARDEADARAGLAQAIGVPLRALDHVAIANAVLTRAAGELPQAALREQALTGRADILAALADYAASQSALQLEIAKQYPDIHLGPGYEYDQSDHKWALGISAELPVLNRNEGGIAEAEAKRSELRARFLALQADVISELDHALEAVRVTRSQLADIDQLLAAQRRQTRAAERQLGAGAADRLDIANARLEASQAEQARVDAEMRHSETLAHLEDVVGMPLAAMGTAERSGTNASE